MTMTVQSINMPKWGMSMSEGKVTKWLVNEGDAIATGMEILEIETDKIANVVESQLSGVLRRKVAAEGETLPVGALLGVLADASVADADIDSFVDANRVAAAETESEQSLLARIQVDGRAINIMDSGGDSTRAFLLVHGFGGDLNNWLFNFAELSHHLRTVAIDLPGHGRSAKDVGDGSAAGLVAAVDGVIDALGLKEVHFVGHSLGGLVVALAAIARPSIAGSVTLLAPAGLATAVDQSFLAAFIEADSRKEMKGVLSRLFFDPSVVTRDMVDDVLQYKRTDGVTAALGLLADNALAKRTPGQELAPRLGDLSLPVTVLWGTKDSVIPMPDMAGSAIEISAVAEKGHMLHMEATKAVNAAILRHVTPG